MAILLKHPYCGDCVKFPCSHITERHPTPNDPGVDLVNPSWAHPNTLTVGFKVFKTDRGQHCGGREFKHRGCFDKNGKEVKELSFYAKLIADDILFEYHFATIEDIIFVYKNGVYVPDGEKVIRLEAQERLRDDLAEPKDAELKEKEPSALMTNRIDCTTHKKQEVVNYIRDGTHISLRGYPTKQEPHIINLKNGLFNLQTWEIQDHTPDIFSVSQIPINYTPDAKCPNILKFISEIVEPVDFVKILELIGYCLYADYPIRAAFMFKGDGANGKSTLLSLIRAFIGRENCSTVSIQQLSDTNRFARANLYGKLANIYDDLPDTALRDTGIFKLLTGQEEIFAEWKGRDGFSFHNYAKLVFSCNQIPRSSDMTPAFFKRWEIVEFNHAFPDNKDLFSTLTTTEELEGLLMLVLKYLDDLLKHCYFSNTLTPEEKQKKYTRLSDSVGAFVLDCLEDDTEGREKKNELYKAYAVYCRKKHYRPVTENIFFRFLHNHIEYGTTRKLEDHIQVWYIAGIRIKTEPDYTGILQNELFAVKNSGDSRDSGDIHTHTRGSLNDYIEGGTKNPTNSTIPTNPGIQPDPASSKDNNDNNKSIGINKGNNDINKVSSLKMLTVQELDAILNRPGGS